MIEVYRSVYHVRQQLVSLKEGLEIQSTTMDQSNNEQCDTSDTEEESTESLKTTTTGIQ